MKQQPIDRETIVDGEECFAKVEVDDSYPGGRGATLVRGIIDGNTISIRNENIFPLPPEEEVMSKPTFDETLLPTLKFFVRRVSMIDTETLAGAEESVLCVIEAAKIVSAIRQAPLIEREGPYTVSGPAVMKDGTIYQCLTNKIGLNSFKHPLSDGTLSKSNATRVKDALNAEYWAEQDKITQGDAVAAEMNYQTILKRDEEIEELKEQCSQLEETLAQRSEVNFVQIRTRAEKAESEVEALRQKLSKRNLLCSEQSLCIKVAEEQRDRCVEWMKKHQTAVNKGPFNTGHHDSLLNDRDRILSEIAPEKGTVRWGFEIRHTSTCPLGTDMQHTVVAKRGEEEKIIAIPSFIQDHSEFGEGICSALNARKESP